jgi:MFS family permease
MHPLPRSWLMLGLALSAQVAVSVVVQAAPTLAPFLQADLKLTRAEVGLFNSALMAGSLIAMFAAGWLVDARGERTALVGGNLMVGLFCLTVLATESFHAALLALFLAGIGAAFPTPAGSRAVMGWFPLAQRGTAMGIRQTGIPLGGAIAAACLPALAIAAGWRIAIAAGGLGCFLTAALCWFGYRNPPPAPGAGTPPVHHRLPRFTDFLTMDVMLLGVSGALLTLGQFTLLTYLAIFLKETQGVPVTVSASLLVAAQIAGAAGRILWGVGSDRLFGQRRRPALIWANGFSAAGALVLGWLPAGTPVWLIAIVVVAYAFNTLGWHGNWIALLAETAGPLRQGRTIGVALSIMYPGIIALPPLFGWLVDRTHSWPGAWTALAAVIGLGIALLLPVAERR